MEMSESAARDLLKKQGQDHVLRFAGELNERQKKALLSQVASLDFSSVARMQGLLAESKSKGAVVGKIDPAAVKTPSGQEKDAARKRGEASIAAGQVGVILVAGGQGSRLGFDGPKGCFELAPITNSTLFSIHSRKILALERRFKAQIPFYIMTSQANDEPTKTFFKKHAHFGLSPDRVNFFTQGMWPALTENGKLVMESKDKLFMSPDGHGGILAALESSGMLADMKKRGLKTLFYFQVDNPLVEIADPAFIGMHEQTGAEMSVKVCAKRDPEEGLGVVVERNGRNAVVEYTELTKEQKHEQLSNGELKFKFGSVAIHVFSLTFLEKEANAQLPLHVAYKKVAFCDESGNIVKPDKPNAYKFEKFIFDALPDAQAVLNYEFAREEEFSPVKNATGSDTADTARRDMMLKFARWFEACGIEVPRKATGEPSYKIEIDPCYALGPDDLRSKLKKGFKIDGDLLLA